MTKYKFKAYYKNLGTTRTYTFDWKSEAQKEKARLEKKGAKCYAIYKRG